MPRGRELNPDRKREVRKIVEPRWGDVFIAELGGDRKSRPVIIIQNNAGNLHSNSVIVVPITSQKKKDLPTHVRIDRRGSKLTVQGTATCENILTIEKSRLGNWVGSIVGTPQEDQVKYAVRVSLNLDEW